MKNQDKPKEWIMQRFDVNHGYQPIFIERYNTLDNGTVIVLVTRSKSAAQKFTTAQASGVAKYLLKNAGILYIPIELKDGVIDEIPF